MKKLMPCIAVLVFMLLVSQAFSADKAVVIPLKSTKKVKNVITVLERGGDFTDPVAAINSITDASDTNPYLVLIGPGKYLLTRSLVMKPYVTIAGSGRGVTILTGAISTDDPSAWAIITGCDNASLRDLAIENSGEGPFSIALFNNESSPIVSDVTAIASGGEYSNFGIRNNSSSSRITNAIATCYRGIHNRCLFNDSSSPIMSNVITLATGGGE